MSMELIALIIVISLFALFALGFSVAFSLITISVIWISVFASPASLTALASVTYTSASADFLLAIPMFIFMATLLEQSGLGSVMYDMMYKWMAGLRGGLAIGTTLISTVIAAMSGVSATATVTMGMIAYPEMKKRGYHNSLSIGTITAGGALGPLIPPSVPMILIAGLSSISIGKLFISGVFPGFLTSLLFIIYISISCWLKPRKGPPIPVSERASWREKFTSLRGAILPILLIIMVLGFIYLGISTPTEAGAIGAFGAFLITIYYRRLSRRNLQNSLRVSLKTTAMVYWLLIAGSSFSTLLNITGVTQYFIERMLSLSPNPWVILITMLAIAYVLGMFIDTGAIIIICIPLFIPIVMDLGFDPLWFGLIFAMDIITGCITPPYGLTMFYFKGLGHRGVTMLDIYKATAPYTIAMTIAWVLCIIYPILVTWLPSTMMK